MKLTINSRSLTNGSKRYDFKDEEVNKAGFVYSNFPTCCLLGIISNLHFSNLSDEQIHQIRDCLRDRMINCEHAVVYATHVTGNSVYDYLIKIGFIPIDINFNPNSGNNVVTLKFIYGRE